MIWCLAFLVWFLVLWYLSSGETVKMPTDGLLHVDKMYHFGYFFGGSGLCSAALYTLTRGKIAPHHMLTWVVLTLTATGCLDEWHQSWVEGRSGNDSMDLTADILGSVAGFHVFRRFIPAFRQH